MADVRLVVVQSEHRGGRAPGGPGPARRHPGRRRRRCHGAHGGVHVVRQERRRDGSLGVEVRHAARRQVVGGRRHGHVVVVQPGAGVRAGRPGRETGRGRQDPLVLRGAVAAAGDPAAAAGVVGRDGRDAGSGAAVLVVVLVVDLVVVGRGRRRVSETQELLDRERRPLRHRTAVCGRVSRDLR